MALFDIDILEGRTSKYETNHMHMIVDGDISYPICDMTRNQYGTFFHEYIHYLQHITTLFGVRMCTMYNKMFILYRDYLEVHDTIMLPLKLWDINEGLSKFITHFNNVRGSRKCEYNVDAVEISVNEIEYAKINKKAVKIGIYDFENEKAIEEGFYFGYMCIIESMAHLIESYIKDELNHAPVPYCTVELVCQSIYKEISNDKKKLISLCYTALMFDNPGYAFFELIEFSKQNPTLDGYQLYQKVLQDFSVKYDKKEMPIYRLLCTFLDDLRDSIKEVLGCELKYYNIVIDNCKSEIRTGKSTLLNILYNSDISNTQLFSDVFAEIYGYPFIEANNMTIMPQNTQTNPPKPYIETASMIGFELIFKRLKSYTCNSTCDRFNRCCKARYTPDDITSEECLFNQWDKKEKCLMTESLRYYRIKDKTYIQG